MWKWELFECGLRPIGAYAYAPVGRVNAERKKSIGQRAWGIGLRD